MTEPTFQSIADQQSWSPESQATVLLNFITSNGQALAGKLATHARRIAAIENGEPTAESSSASHQPSAHADEILADLIDQIDAIGIPDWAGAEGLSLDAARLFLANHAQRVRDDRAYAASLQSISWDEPDFPYAEWQFDVANGDTRRSYAEWVFHNREQADHPGCDPSH